MHMTVADIEAQIEEEKRSTCAESHSAAWAEGRWAGIEPEIIAEAALDTALSELSKNEGEDSLMRLLDRMRERVQSGEYMEGRTHH